MTRLQSPGEVEAPSRSRLYSEFILEDSLSAPYALPPQFLRGVREEATAISDCPLIVFINAKSGGRTGPALALAFSRALGRLQVFDVGEHRPDKVLAKIWSNFKAAIAAGEPNAALYQQRLRVVVAGGDGTIAWVLSSIKTLGLKPAPPVAIIPLGTGNDMARSFGWGDTFHRQWVNGYKSIYSTFLRFVDAQVEDLDVWKVTLSLPSSDLLGQLPHSIVVMDSPPSPHSPASQPGGAVPSVLQSTGEGPRPCPSVKSGPPAVARGMFWNYLSVGLDAKAAYHFHHMREHSPHLARGQLTNQAWYSWFACATGWFCCTQPLASRATLQVQRPGSDHWDTVVLPSNIKALVLLNLQSYAGGRNLWGTAPTTTQPGGPPLKEPSYHDGLLEVVGLSHGAHTAVVMGSKGELLHAKRICQASGVRLALQAQHVRADGTPSHAYLQVDGEPWMQNVPSAKDTQPLVIEVTHAGTSHLLHNHKSLSTPRTAQLPIKRAALPIAPIAPLASGELQGHDKNYSTQMNSVPALLATMPAVQHSSAVFTAAESDAAQLGSECASSRPSISGPNSEIRR